MSKNINIPKLPVSIASGIPITLFSKGKPIFKSDTVRISELTGSRGVMFNNQLAIVLQVNVAKRTCKVQFKTGTLAGNIKTIKIQNIELVSHGAEGKKALAKMLTYSISPTTAGSSRMKGCVRFIERELKKVKGSKLCRRPVCLDENTLLGSMGAKQYAYAICNYVGKSASAKAIRSGASIKELTSRRRNPSLAYNNVKPKTGRAAYGPVTKGWAIPARQAYRDGKTFNVSNINRMRGNINATRRRASHLKKVNKTLRTAASKAVGPAGMLGVNSVMDFIGNNLNSTSSVEKDAAMNIAGGASKAHTNVGMSSKLRGMVSNFVGNNVSEEKTGSLLLFPPQNAIQKKTKKSKALNKLRRRRNPYFSRPKPSPSVNYYSSNNNNNNNVPNNGSKSSSGGRRRRTYRKKRYRKRRYSRRR